MYYVYTKLKWYWSGHMIEIKDNQCALKALEQALYNQERR